MKWCYKHYVEKTKPKNIFKKAAYKIWLWCGASPSGLGAYLDNNGFKSQAQRKWAYTKEGTKALGGKKAVVEWEKATKGKLPKKAKKK